MKITQIAPAADINLEKTVADDEQDGSNNSGDEQDQRASQTIPPTALPKSKRKGEKVIDTSNNGDEKQDQKASQTTPPTALPKSKRKSEELIDTKSAVEKKPKLSRSKCPVCNKEITTKQLKRHITEIHSDAPQYHCDLCTFATKREDQLQKHKRAQHLEPMQRGRPSKSVKSEKRKRSPFRKDEFERRHSNSMKIIQQANELKEWKENFKKEMNDMLTAKLALKDKEIAAKDVELEKLKIRIAILERKSKNDNPPSLDDIDGLFAYLNLDKNASLKQIREAVKYRVYEVDIESPIESNAVSDMNKEEREKMTIYLNQLQCVLTDWKKDQNA